MRSRQGDGRRNIQVFSLMVGCIFHKELLFLLSSCTLLPLLLGPYISHLRCSNVPHFITEAHSTMHHCVAYK